RDAPQGRDLGASQVVVLRDGLDAYRSARSEFGRRVQARGSRPANPRTRLHRVHAHRQNSTLTRPCSPPPPPPPTPGPPPPRPPGPDCIDFPLIVRTAPCPVPARLPAAAPAGIH